MSDFAPRLYVQVMERVRTGEYQHRDITIGVSNLSVEASPEDIELAIGKGVEVYEAIRDKMRAEIDRIRNPFDLSAVEFKGPHCQGCGDECMAVDLDKGLCPECREKAEAYKPERDADAEWMAETASSREKIEAFASGKTDIALIENKNVVDLAIEKHHGKKQLASDEIYEPGIVGAAGDTFVAEGLVKEVLDGAIPHEDEVVSGIMFFGCQIEPGDPEWQDEPITDINVDGSGGGQLKAVNSALSGAGYTDSLRHDALSVLLGRTIGSVRDLSKLDAHRVLNWFEKAEDQHYRALRCGVDISIGQEALL